MLKAFKQKKINSHISRLHKLVPQLLVVAEQTLLLISQLLPTGTQHFQLAETEKSDKMPKIAQFTYINKIFC